MNEIACKCGRIWELDSGKFIERDPGAVKCACGETLMQWGGSRPWFAKRLIKGLPEDEGKPLPCSYE
jgi:hypothetical protein